MSPFVKIWYNPSPIPCQQLSAFGYPLPLSVISSLNYFSAITFNPVTQNRKFWAFGKRVADAYLLLQIINICSPHAAKQLLPPCCANLQVNGLHRRPPPAPTQLYRLTLVTAAQFYIQLYTRSATIPTKATQPDEMCATDPICNQL